MMAILWILFISSALLFSCFSHNGASLTAAALEGAQSAMELGLSLGGSLCLWCGVAKLMEVSGAQNFLAKCFAPLLQKVFPNAAKKPMVFGQISANFSANLLGLGNAATPFGIAATKSMVSPTSPQIATHEMCRLVVLNTASIQLLPTTVASLRSGLGCGNPLDILPAVWCTSLCSVAVGLVAAWVFQRVWP